MRDVDPQVWQEDGSGQECHAGSGLELDFPFVPLPLRRSPGRAAVGVMMEARGVSSQGAAAALKPTAPPLSLPPVLGGGQRAEFLHL